MKTKFIITSVALAAVVMSCRQTDETTFEDSMQQNLTEKANSNEMGKEGEVPKDGTHWKTNAKKDSVDLTKSFINSRIDSTGLKSEIIEGGPKDVPRDGTHWRSSGK